MEMKNGCLAFDQHNKDIEFIPGEEFEESNTRKLEKNILKN